MTDADRPAFASLLLALGDAFSEPITEGRAEIYFDALRDHPLTAVQAAGRQLVKTQEFFPRVMHFLALLETDAGEQAESLVEDVRQRVIHTGRYRTPVLTDAEAALVTALGGWETLCESMPAVTEPDYKWAHKRYLSLAQTIVRRQALALGAGTRQAQLVEGE